MQSRALAEYVRYANVYIKSLVPLEAQAFYINMNYG
jgi:hypothetical protein